MGSSTHIFIRKQFRKFAPHDIYTSLLRMISQNVAMENDILQEFGMHFKIYEWNI